MIAEKDVLKALFLKRPGETEAKHKERIARELPGSWRTHAATGQCIFTVNLHPEWDPDDLLGEYLQQENGKAMDLCFKRSAAKGLRKAEQKLEEKMVQYEQLD